MEFSPPYQKNQTEQPASQSTDRFREDRYLTSPAPFIDSRPEASSQLHLIHQIRNSPVVAQLASQQQFMRQSNQLKSGNRLGQVLQGKFIGELAKLSPDDIWEKIVNEYKSSPLTLFDIEDYASPEKPEIGNIDELITAFFNDNPGMMELNPNFSHLFPSKGKEDQEHKPVNQAGLQEGIVGLPKVEELEEKHNAIPKALSLENLIDLGNNVISEAKKVTPHGAANQLEEGEIFDPKQAGKESQRRILSLLAYQKVQYFLTQVNLLFEDRNSHKELVQKWDSYFMHLGFMYKPEGYQEEFCSFTPSRDSEIIHHFVTAYAVQKLGGAVCAQYAPYVALRLSDIAPELKVRLRSGGGHAYSTAQAPHGPEVVVDPWPHSKNQSAHSIENIKDQLKPESETPGLTLEGGYYSTSKKPEKRKAPSMSQFFTFMDQNIGLICQLAKVSVNPNEAKPDDGKPEKMDWNIATSQKEIK